MLKQLHVPFFGLSESKPSSGEEKFTFLCGALSAIGVACAIAYSMFARLSWPQGWIVSIGGGLVGFAIAFVFSELYRSGGSQKTRAAEPANKPDVYASRSVSANPSTGEAYPHHEDYTESQGFDQGQLTARIPGSTPFFDK